jgi:hypothetical protein
MTFFALAKKVWFKDSALATLQTNFCIADFIV